MKKLLVFIIILILFGCEKENFESQTESIIEKIQMEVTEQSDTLKENEAPIIKEFTIADIAKLENNYIKLKCVAIGDSLSYSWYGDGEFKSDPDNSEVYWKSNKPGKYNLTIEVKNGENISLKSVVLENNLPDISTFEPLVNVPDTSISSLISSNFISNSISNSVIGTITPPAPWNIDIKAQILLGCNINNKDTSIIEAGIIMKDWIVVSNVAVSNTRTYREVKMSIPKNENGKYIAEINGLFPNAEYFYRAYAINSHGISYGEEIYFHYHNDQLGIDLDETWRK